MKKSVRFALESEDSICSNKSQLQGRIYNVYSNPYSSHNGDNNPLTVSSTVTSTVASTVTSTVASTDAKSDRYSSLKVTPIATSKHFQETPIAPRQALSRNFEIFLSHGQFLKRSFIPHAHVPRQTSARSPVWDVEKTNEDRQQLNAFQSDQVSDKIMTRPKTAHYRTICHPAYLTADRYCPTEISSIKTKNVDNQIILHKDTAPAEDGKLCGSKGKLTKHKTINPKLWASGSLQIINPAAISTIVEYNDYADDSPDISTFEINAQKTSPITSLKPELSRDTIKDDADISENALVNSNPHNSLPGSLSSILPTTLKNSVLCAKCDINFLKSDSKGECISTGMQGIEENSRDCANSLSDVSDTNDNICNESNAAQKDVNEKKSGMSVKVKEDLAAINGVCDYSEMNENEELDRLKKEDGKELRYVETTEDENGKERLAVLQRKTQIQRKVVIGEQETTSREGDLELEHERFESLQKNFERQLGELQTIQNIYENGLRQRQSLEETIGLLERQLTFQKQVHQQEKLRWTSPLFQSTSCSLFGDSDVAIREYNEGTLSKCSGSFSCSRPITAAENRQQLFSDSLVEDVSNPSNSIIVSKQAQIQCPQSCGNSTPKIQYCLEGVHDSQIVVESERLQSGSRRIVPVAGSERAQECSCSLVSKSQDLPRRIPKISASTSMPCNPHIPGFHLYQQKAVRPIRVIHSGIERSKSLFAPVNNQRRGRPASSSLCRSQGSSKSMYADFERSGSVDAAHGSFVNIDGEAVPHTYNSSTSSAITDLKIMDVPINGKYIRLVNTSKNKDTQLGNHILQQVICSRPVALYRFPPRSIIPPLGTVTVWAGIESSVNKERSTADYVFINHSQWTYGPQCMTMLCKPNGEAIAWHRPSYRQSNDAFMDKVLPIKSNNQSKDTAQYSGKKKKVPTATLR